MAPRRWNVRAALLVLPLGLLSACIDEPPLPDSGVAVFGDAFATGLAPNPFTGSSTSASSVDGGTAKVGAASWKLAVPASASGWTGGAVLSGSPVDLTGTNALAFWAKASTAATFNSFGFGLDFGAQPGNTTYATTLANLPLTTEWVRHVIPIPDPSRLTAVLGMAWWSEAEATGYDAWFDDVRYDTFDAAALDLQASMASASKTLAVGGTAQVAGLSITYLDLDGTRRSLEKTDPGTGPAPAWFTFTSSSPSVATVSASGTITGVAQGDTTITATLAGAAVSGSVSVHVGGGAAAGPTTAPATPTLAAANVISLLSRAYTNVAVDTWGTTWSNGGAGPNLTEVTVGGDPVKKYASLQFIGVEFIGSAGAAEIDATAMTHLHLDLWTPDATVFKVKLVDFGADKAFDASGHVDDSEAELTFNASSTPALATGRWVSLELPLASFSGLASRAHLAQLVLSASTATVFVDNVYFHK